MLRGGGPRGARGPKPRHHAPHLHRLPATGKSRGRGARWGRRGRRGGEDAARDTGGRRGRRPPDADPTLRRVHPGRAAAPRCQPRHGGGGGERRRGMLHPIFIRRGRRVRGRVGALPRRGLPLVRGHRRARHEDPRDGPTRRARHRPARAPTRGSQQRVPRAARTLALDGLQAEHGRRSLQTVQRRAAGEGTRVPRLRRRHGRPTRPGSRTSVHECRRRSVIV